MGLEILWYGRLKKISRGYMPSQEARFALEWEESRSGASQLTPPIYLSEIQKFDQKTGRSLVFQGTRLKLSV
jgi:hypothetical protein